MLGNSLPSPYRRQWWGWWQASPSRGVRWAEVAHGYARYHFWPRGKQITPSGYVSGENRSHQSQYRSYSLAVAHCSGSESLGWGKLWLPKRIPCYVQPPTFTFLLVRHLIFRTVFHITSPYKIIFQAVLSIKKPFRSTHLSI